jgi:hypothetical protein
MVLIQERLTLAMVTPQFSCGDSSSAQGCPLSQGPQQEIKSVENIGDDQIRFGHSLSGRSFFSDHTHP